MTQSICVLYFALICLLAVQDGYAVVSKPTDALRSDGFYAAREVKTVPNHGSKSLTTVEKENTPINREKIVRVSTKDKKSSTGVQDVIPELNAEHSAVEVPQGPTDGLIDGPSSKKEVPSVGRDYRYYAHYHYNTIYFSAITRIVSRTIYTCAFDTVSTMSRILP